MHRRLSLVLVVAVAATLVLPALDASATETQEWEITGSGWGHGVGMSQYGAFAMALEGASAVEILAHYYSGAEITDLATRALPAWWVDPYPVTIGLDQGAESVTVTTTPEGTGAELCRETCIPVGAAGLTVTTPGEKCVVTDNASTASHSGSCAMEVRWTDDGGTTRVRAAGDEHAHGTIRVSPDGAGRVHVTITQGLEDYLRGIAELPGDWPAAAQEAQVIAARNFAVRRVIERGQAGLAACGGCQLYDTVRDQVYRGWTKEGIRPNKWVSAVESTAGLVAIHPETKLVFTAYYSSSTGGKTENNEDVWGSTPLPYLRSVDDPGSLHPDVGNPFASWTRLVTESYLAARLGWDTVTGIDLVRRAPGAVVRMTGTDGGAPVSTELKGDPLRTTLGVPSAFLTAVDGAPARPDLTGDDPVGGRFTDIDGNVHAEAIEVIAALGITRGCNPPDNTIFCPAEPVTRGQMAAFLHRALPDLPAVGEAPAFSDAGTVFDADIAWLAQVGVTKGCADDRFCPERAVTRGEMAAFLSRAFGYTELPEADLFGDDDTSVFETDIERLAVAGVTFGCNPPENTRFCPADAVTRGQMASFLARALAG